MNMYKDFIKERTDCEFIELDNKGWASYRINDKICTLYNVYVVPEERLKGTSQQLGVEVENIAREKGCKILITKVELTKEDGDRANLYSILKFGFKLKSSGTNYLVFVKEI